MPDLNFSVILPLTFLTVWACLLLLADLLVKQRGITAFLAALGLALTLGLTLIQIGVSDTAFNNMVIVDGFSTFINALLLVSGLLGVALAYGYLKRMGLERGEYYTLLLFSIVGMMLMAQAGDLIIVFLALELLSIPLYILSAFARPRADSEEAGLKYFLLGTFSSGFIVYGIALVFGATGSTSLGVIVKNAGAAGTNPLLLTVGAGLILVGLAPPPGPVLRALSGAFAEALKTGRVQTPEAQELPMRNWDLGEGPVRALVAPLVAGTDQLGVVVVVQQGRKAYSEAETEMLHTFASQAAIGITKSRLFEREVESRRVAESLRDVAEELVRPVPFPDALAAVTGLVSRSLDGRRTLLAFADRVALGLPQSYDPDLEQLVLDVAKAVVPTDDTSRTVGPGIAPQADVQSSVVEVDHESGTRVGANGRSANDRLQHEVSREFVVRHK